MKEYKDGFNFYGYVLYRLYVFKIIDLRYQNIRIRLLHPLGFLLLIINIFLFGIVEIIKDIKDGDTYCLI